MKDNKEENEDLVLGDVYPYLEYGLEVERIYEDNFLTAKINDIETISISDALYYFGGDCHEFNSIKPLLIPLSKYADFKSVQKVSEDLNCEDEQTAELIQLSIGIRTVDQIKVGLLKIMCKHHIDFNNLIPQGKAAVKTLDK